MRVRVIRLAAFVALLLLPAPGAAAAQQTGKVPRIGFLSASLDRAPTRHAFREGLHDFGYVEGQNIAIEWRWAHGDATRLPTLAAELVGLKVDVIVTVGNAATEEAQRATGTTPIVMTLTDDVVRSGFVTGIARPGGTITGLSTQYSEIASKGLQLLKEAVPNLTRVAILWDPALPVMRWSVEQTEIAAKAFGAQVQVLEARSPNDLGRAFGQMITARADAVVVHGSGMLFVNRSRIAEQAVRNRLPSLCSLREYVEAGCLMSYWVSLAAQYRRAAYFVDRILKGAKPADLPVEQPTKFEFVINMKTGRELGLNISPSLLIQADAILK